MKKTICSAINVTAALAVFCLFSPVISNAEVNVRVAIPLPPLVIPAPPALVVIPGSYVYYPPDIGADIFFYQDYWYRPYQGRWFRAKDYNGPWRGIAIARMPRTVIGVPPGFRRGPIVYERVPYGDVKRNWRVWESERHWDRDRYNKRGRTREDEGRGERDERGREHERQDR
jgi:hypothetical protein